MSAAEYPKHDVFVHTIVSVLGTNISQGKFGSDETNMLCVIATIVRIARVEMIVGIMRIEKLEGDCWAVAVPHFLLGCYYLAVLLPIRPS